MYRKRNEISKRVLLFCLLIVCITGKTLRAQDLHFSQYGEAPLALNPALAAVAYDIRVITNYKNQWASVASPFKTFGFSAELGLKYRKRDKAYISTGMAAYKDKAGDGQLGTTHVSFSVGGVVRAGAYSKISGAFLAGLTMKSIDPGVFQWGNQYDGYTYVPGSPTGEKFVPGNFSYADFSAGANWHYSKSDQYISATHGVRFDVGAAAFHVNTPTNSFLHATNEHQLMRYATYANVSIALKDSRMCLQPGIIYMVQGGSYELMSMFMLKYIIQDQSVHTATIKPCAISFGGQYRLKDAFIPALLFEYDKYALGFSYDLNLSPLSTVSKMKGGLEIALRFNWNPGYGKMLGGSYNRPTYK